MITCLECNNQFKSSLSSHLVKHGLNKQTYLEKYPNGSIISKEYLERIKKERNSEERKKKASLSMIDYLQKNGHPMKGKNHTEESKKKNSDTHFKLYEENSALKDLISKRTKEGMRKEESWNKFMNHIETREVHPENLGKYAQKERLLTEEEYNKAYSKQRNEKISHARKEYWSDKKGKTVEELWGEEIGKELRKLRSTLTSGEKNPGFGKVFKKAGSCKLGYYKGHFFRGILEYSYLKRLENQNISFKYEPFFIPYELEGVKRTYTPDFLLISDKKLIEVKPSFLLTEEYFCKEVNAKKQAAEKWCQENGYTYHILTEKDFPIMTYAQAYADKNVEWIRK